MSDGPLIVSVPGAVTTTLNPAALRKRAHVWVALAGLTVIVPELTKKSGAPVNIVSTPVCAVQPVMSKCVSHWKF